MGYAAAEIFREAERRLRELLTQKASAGEYDGVQRLAEWARQLATMARQAEDGHGSDGASESASALAAEGPAGLREAAGAGISRGTGRVSRQKQARGGYPAFFRQGDQLVKIGWSRKQHAEYQHRAPRRVVELLASAIAKRSASGRLFTSDDILPLKDPQDGSEIPAYQAYVALAWFRAAGLVKQHGRRGYTVKSQGKLAYELAAAWQNLSGLPA